MNGNETRLEVGGSSGLQDTSSEESVTLKSHKVKRVRLEERVLRRSSGDLYFRKEGFIK